MGKPNFSIIHDKAHFWLQALSLFALLACSGMSGGNGGGGPVGNVATQNAAAPSLPTGVSAPEVDWNEDKWQLAKVDVTVEPVTEGDPTSTDKLYKVTGTFTCAKRQDGSVFPGCDAMVTLAAYNWFGKKLIEAPLKRIDAATAKFEVVFKNLQEQSGAGPNCQYGLVFGYLPEDPAYVSSNYGAEQFCFDARYCLGKNWRLDSRYFECNFPDPFQYKVTNPELYIPSKQVVTPTQELSGGEGEEVSGQVPPIFVPNL